MFLAERGSDMKCYNITFLGCPSSAIHSDPDATQLCADWVGAVESGSQSLAVLLEWMVVIGPKKPNWRRCSLPHSYAVGSFQRPRIRAGKGITTHLGTPLIAVTS